MGNLDNVNELTPALLIGMVAFRIFPREVFPEFEGAQAPMDEVFDHVRAHEPLRPQLVDGYGQRLHHLAGLGPSPSRMMIEDRSCKTRGQPAPCP